MSITQIIAISSIIIVILIFFYSNIVLKKYQKKLEYRNERLKILNPAFAEI